MELSMRAMPAWAFVRLADADAPEEHGPDVLPLLHAAGNPYFDWLFGDPSLARGYLTRCIARASSELSLHRVTLLRQGNRTLGCFLWLSGAELLAARRHDAVALVHEVPPWGFPDLMKRLRDSQGLFPAPDPEESYLSKMGVHVAWRGKGIGRRLLQGYLDQSRQQGFRRLRLDVAADNAPAVHLYRRAGFTTVHRASAGGGALRYLSMTCALSAPHDDRESCTPP